MSSPINLGALRPIVRNSNANASTENAKKVMTFADLAKEQLATKVTEEIPFPVTVMVTSKGTVVFSAQLKGGRRIGLTPVMPKDPVTGENLAPENGVDGWLTIEKSENAELTLDATGRYDLSIRPKFVAFETCEDREQRLAAEKAKSGK